MYVILLGPPGAGKGTQGALLSDRLRLPRVATGDLLRSAVRAGTRLGIEARSYIEQGLLVPDDVIVGLISEVLASREAEAGVIMDGFPRTVAQAEAVERRLASFGNQVDHVVSITVPQAELERRLLGRAQEQERSDDAPEAIRQRLAVYASETEPLVTYYRDRGLLRTIDGVGAVQDVATRIDEALGR